jgi:hypothetical protein
MSTAPTGWVASAPRVLGWVTATYSAAPLVRPQVVGQPCGYLTATGGLPRPVGTLIAAVGARDVVSGLAMALAPRGTPLRIAIAVRVAVDLSDAWSSPSAYGSVTVSYASPGSPHCGVRYAPQAPAVLGNKFPTARVCAPWPTIGRAQR